MYSLILIWFRLVVVVWCNLTPTLFNLVRKKIILSIFELEVLACITDELVGCYPLLRGGIGSRGF